MDAIEKLILAIGLTRVANELLTDGRLNAALKEMGTALDEAVEQAADDAEKDAA